VTLRRFDIDRLPATPWKNGGGVTREIACHPSGAGIGDFLWRLSIATIARDGPFSLFPGIDRLIALLDGPGVRLVTADGAINHWLDRPLEPYAFAGETPIEARVPGGASSDFNVMTRRADLRAHLDVLRSSHDQPGAPHGMLLAVAGQWRARGNAGRDFVLDPRQGLWWADEARAWLLAPGSPGGCLLALRIVSANTTEVAP
jgi:environmental stress-induced protein Ves